MNNYIEIYIYMRVIKNMVLVIGQKVGTGYDSN